MPNLDQNIRELQAQASVLCAQCLQDEITLRAEALEELTGRLETTTRAGQSYLDAFAELMAAVLVLATFAAELTKRHPSDWIICPSTN